ncbi:MAG: excinuclease ABC subunit UvrC, partial [Bacteroidales bacterium]
MGTAKSEHLSLILKTLPEKPGVYRFFDENEKILYVGKAKNLKRRVSSYFNKQHDPGKLRLLVLKIRDIQTTVVDSEWEALLLENSMIKEFRPRYNVMLKDDKSYPWIAISKEEFPRIYSTRNPDRHHTQLFGPYASVRYMNVLLETITEIFPLRTCRRLLKNERPCMQYQIKKCAAPCAGFISGEEYQNNIKKIIEIIRGNSKSVIHQLKEEMMNCADRWEFEKAQALKEKIEILENFIGKSVVVNPEITRLDVFSIAEDEDSAYVNFLRIVDGAIVQAYTLEINNKLDKTPEELLLLGMLEIQERFGTLFPELLVPFMPELSTETLHFTVPIRGDKKKLLELSEKNAKFFMLEKKKRLDLVNPERHQQRVLIALQKALGMKELPVHIECFDNSNTQGEEPVAAMVCFLNGKPAKKEYRHYNIKTVEGPDDFASMEEVVYRRYKRLLEEEKPLPDLVVIDGGKGQLHAAYQALSTLSIAHRIMLIGIAKRLEDIYKVGD